MNSYALQEIITQDGLVHQGIFFHPENSGKRALLWVHGLTSSFYSGGKMLEAYSDACAKYGWGFASFNTRGHDQVAGMKKIDPRDPKGFGYAKNGGAGYEEFKDCIYDIHACVDFLVSRGFSEIILIGHSTGANKTCFAEGTKPHKNIYGVVLTGPMSDRLHVDQEKVKNEIHRMEQLKADGKGEELIVGLHFFPMTPNRFLSLYKPGSFEDVFDYDKGEAGLSVFSKIKKPLCVVVSECDENLDRPAPAVIKEFDRHTSSKVYKSIVFPDSLHGFDGKEKEAVAVITDWISSI